MLVWFSAPFDLRGGLRIGWALSLPPHEVLTSTPVLSSFYVTIIASSEEFPPGQQQIGSQTVSKSAKDDDMDPNQPTSPTAA